MKKVAIISLFTFIFSMLSFESNAQKNKETIIQTSAQCEMCKERLESNLSFEKGIKDVNLDMETKKILISYNPKKTDLSSLKKLISEIGYDADDIKANTVVYKNLPTCCKKPEDR